MATPLMIARMMISLKDSAAETTGRSYIPTITNAGNRRLPADGSQSLRFVSPMLSGLHGTSEIPNEEGVELDSMPRHRNVDLGMMK